MVKITSPVDVEIIFHGPDQAYIPLELSTPLIFDGKHKVSVKVEKTVNLNLARNPCYAPEDNKGKPYWEHNYEILNKNIIDLFNCTSPIIPLKFRGNGNVLCHGKELGIKVHDYIKSTSTSFTATIWSKDSYTVPPCTYYKYHVKEQKLGKLHSEPCPPLP